MCCVFLSALRRGGPPHNGRLVLSQLVGSGNDKELFYTDSRCKQAYKNYVSMLLNRVNTYTGVQYKNDPTMFSFELMVSFHTSCVHAKCKKITMQACFTANATSLHVSIESKVLLFRLLAIQQSAISLDMDALIYKHSVKNRLETLFVMLVCMQNEPHTRDLYEINRGLPPGKLVRDWIYEMSAFVKSIDSNHMVSCHQHFVHSVALA